MDQLYLVEPTKEYEKQAIDYIKEHYEYNSNINGSGGLDRYINDYDEWLNKLLDDKKRIPNEERVPSETYFLVRKDDNKIIGMINIRLTLNNKLRALGGNIGYGIRPTERRKGYNKVNLYLGLLICSKHNIKNVQLDCDKSNLGSKKTIESLGGILQREYYSDEEKCIILSYNIDVEKSIKENKEVYSRYIYMR